MSGERADELNLDDGTGDSTIFPIARWLPAYKPSWLKKDIIAGFVIAAGSIPFGMAYATLAGLPPQYGLYASLIAPLIYCIFATSRQAVIGPCSIQAMLIASVIGLMALEDVSRYLALASCTALIVGIFALIAWKLHLGFLQNVISLPILKGFIAGAGIVIIIHEIPVLLGITGAPVDLPARILYTFQNAGLINTYSLVIGVSCLLILLVIGRFFPSLPLGFILLVGVIILSSRLHLAQLGVPVIGIVPAGMPAVAIPIVTAHDLLLLIPLGLALFLVSYVELGSITRMYANRLKYNVNTTQELLAFGLSSIGTGLFQGFPVSGNTSRSRINYRMGAITQLAGIIACVLIIIVLFFFSVYFYYVPFSFLAALIIAAVISIIDISGLQRIGIINKGELTLALITCVCVLLCGIQVGVLVAIVLSLLSVLYQVSYPHVPMLGRFPGTTLYGDIDRDPIKEPTPKILIVRIDLPFIFANSEIIYSQIYQLLQHPEEPVMLVIIDLYSSPVIDVTAVTVIKDLYRDLSKQGIALRIAEASPVVRDTLRRAGIEKQIGILKPDTTVTAVIEEWRKDLNRKYSNDFYQTIPVDKRSIHTIGKK